MPKQDPEKIVPLDSYHCPSIPFTNRRSSHLPFLEPSPSLVASGLQSLGSNEETMKGKLGRAICRIAQEDKPIPQVQVGGTGGTGDVWRAWCFPFQAPTFF